VSTPEKRILHDWHKALNACSADRLVELSHPDVEVGGPRASGHGSHETEVL
jgi:hypothetical protein